MKCNDIKEYLYEDDEYFCLLDFQYINPLFDQKVASKVFLEYFLANDLQKFLNISNAFSFVIYKKSSKGI